MIRPEIDTAVTDIIAAVVRKSHRKCLMPKEPLTEESVSIWQAQMMVKTKNPQLKTALILLSEMGRSHHDNTERLQRLQEILARI